MLKIHDVGLRDGLQNEARIVDKETKLAWARELIKAKIDMLQVGSFVHKEKVPQMADTDELFTVLSKESHRNTILSGLVLNEKGMERALNCGVEMLCMGVSASEIHSYKNTRMTTDEATKRIINIAKESINAGKKVQVSVQSAFGCGFEGKVPYSNVLNIIEKYFENGLINISLADTAGHAHPKQVSALIENILKINDNAELTAHFHNTYGMGIANCLAAYDMGVKNFETAFGGLGGCPFTKVAAGNVASEDFVMALQRMNLKSDINLDIIINVAKSASNYLEKTLEGYVYKTGIIEYKIEE